MKALSKAVNTPARAKSIGGRPETVGVLQWGCSVEKILRLVSVVRGGIWLFKMQERCLIRLGRDAWPLQVVSTPLKPGARWGGSQKSLDLFLVIYPVGEGRFELLSIGLLRFFGEKCPLKEGGALERRSFSPTA